MDDRQNNKVIDFKLAKGEGETAFYSKFGNYKPDEELLQSTARIKHQRDVIKERLDLMEASRERVAKSVYEKVKRDYSLQLQTINELLGEKKLALKKEVKDLYLRREKLSVEINRHREILEEAEFRNFLGEFTQTQYQEVEGFETKEIEKLETDLARISEFIRVHEELLDPEDLGLPPVQRESIATKSPTPTLTQEVTKTVARELPKPQPQPPQAKPQPQKPIAKELPIPPVVKQEPVSPAAPSVPPASEEASDVTDASEFEDLFLDEDADQEKNLSESRSKINKIIEDVVQPPETKAEKSADYFSEQSLNDSLTIKKGDFTPGEESTPRPATISKIDDGLPQPQEKVISTSLSNKKPTVDDSISDILNSIQIGEANAEQPTTPASGAPVATPPAQAAGDTYVFYLIEGDLEQKEYTLKDNTSIGRSPSNDIVLKAPKVSRQHAAINMYNNQFIIIDLKSSNGVFVNGAKIDECILNPGDEVSVGGYKFTFKKLT